jgi:hypothetical protein
LNLEEEKTFDLPPNILSALANHVIAHVRFTVYGGDVSRVAWITAEVL